MSNAHRSRPDVSLAAVVALASLTACGGSGGNPPHAVPSPAATPLRSTQAQAARGTLQLALRQIATARYYAQFLRLGIGPVFGLGGTTTPTCDPASDTAVQAFTSQTGTQTLLTIAAYPAGDSACSQSPERVLSLSLSKGSTTTSVNGYEIIYASATDPLFPAGSIAGTEQLQAGIADDADGAADIDTRIDDFGSPPGNGVAQPAPGVFPATFPTAVPTPQPITPAFAPDAYYATVESGNASTTGTATGGAGFNSTNGQQGDDLGTLDTLKISASNLQTGLTTLGTTSSDPLYAIDFGASETVTVAPSPFPLPAGQTAQSLLPLSSLGIRSNALNFPTPAQGSATYAANGDLTACGVTYADAPNGVSTAVTCNADGTLSVVMTDTIAHAAVTAPATIVLDATGNSTPFKYALDGTSDMITNFLVQPSQS